ncbi:MAG: CDP-alcohol phosphatidyltransferase family protein [Thiotrichales bacterium]|nr:CDP-alcohol phosphatidyltransferase family protein [Thiotrichales bacterium]
MDSESSSGPEYVISRPGQLFPLSRTFAYFITPYLLRLPVTPNQVTAASLFAGLAGTACFLFGQWGWNIAGALLIVLSYTLDYCDGEIARIKNMVTPFGERFDDIADSLVDSMFFVMLGTGTTLSTGRELWMWLGIAAAAGAVINYAINTYRNSKARSGASPGKPVRPDKPKQAETRLDRVIYILHKLSRAEFCNIILILAVFNVAWILLPLAAIGAQLYWITGLFPRVHIWHARN